MYSPKKVEELSNRLNKFQCQTPKLKMLYMWIKQEKVSFSEFKVILKNISE
jgi:hypothetical protein